MERKILKTLINNCIMSASINADMIKTFGLNILKLERGIVKEHFKNLDKIIEGPFNASIQTFITSPPESEHLGVFTMYLMEEYECGFIIVNVFVNNTFENELGIEISTYIKPEFRGLGLAYLAKVIYCYTKLNQLSQTLALNPVFVNYGKVYKASSAYLVSEINYSNMASLLSIKKLLVSNPSNIRFIIQNITMTDIIFTTRRTSDLTENHQMQLFNAIGDYDDMSTVINNINTRLKRKRDYDINLDEEEESRESLMKIIKMHYK